MTSNIRNNRLYIKINNKERERFDNLWNSLQEQCNISPKRQSEIIIEGFFQYAENLLASYVPHTNTKSQSLLQERKEAIFNLIEQIKEKGFMYYGQSVVELIHGNECFNDLSFRTKSNYIQKFLRDENLYFIYLPYYFKSNTLNPIVLIHRDSKWYPQIKDLCFSVKENIYKLTHEKMSDSKLKSTIFERLKRKAKYKTDIDKAEKVMLNVFLYEIGELKENPMYDQTDLVLREVIELRSQLRFNEAKELLEKEKEHKKNQELGLKKQVIKIQEDNGLDFLNKLEVIEE